MADRHLREADLHPLHFEILRILPVEGSVLGYHRLTKTTPQVADELNKKLAAGIPKMSNHEVAGALKSMQVAQFTVNIKLVGAGLGWQATTLGKDVWKRYEQQHPSTD